MYASTNPPTPLGSTGVWYVFCLFAPSCCPPPWASECPGTVGGGVGGGLGKPRHGLPRRPPEYVKETNKNTHTPKSSVVETLAPKKVGKMVPEWSQFSILSFLLILKPLSIDSSVFEGPRDSFSSLLSCFVLTPFPDLYFSCF